MQTTTTISPPKHFAIVEPGVYRCAYPRTLAQVQYLRSLRPQTILVVSNEAVPKAVRRALEAPYPRGMHEGSDFGSTVANGSSDAMLMVEMTSPKVMAAMRAAAAGEAQQSVSTPLTSTAAGTGASIVPQSQQDGSSVATTMVAGVTPASTTAAAPTTTDPLNGTHHSQVAATAASTASPASGTESSSNASNATAITQDGKGGESGGVPRSPLSPNPSGQTQMPDGAATASSTGGSPITPPATSSSAQQQQQKQQQLLQQQQQQQQAAAYAAVDNPFSLSVAHTIRPLNQPVVVDLSPLGWEQGASLSSDVVAQALEYVFDASTYPLVIMGPSGEVETSAVVCGLRRLQGWVLSSVVGEATLFASSGQPKRRLVEFVEQLQLDRYDYLPHVMLRRRQAISEAIMTTIQQEQQWEELRRKRFALRQKALRRHASKLKRAAATAAIGGTTGTTSATPNNNANSKLQRKVSSSTGGLAASTMGGAAAGGTASAAGGSGDMAGDDDDEEDEDEGSGSNDEGGRYASLYGGAASGDDVGSDGVADLVDDYGFDYDHELLAHMQATDVLPPELGSGGGSSQHHHHQHHGAPSYMGGTGFGGKGLGGTGASRLLTSAAVNRHRSSAIQHLLLTSGGGSAVVDASFVSDNGGRRGGGGGGNSAGGGGGSGGAFSMTGLFAGLNTATKPQSGAGNNTSSSNTNNASSAPHSHHSSPTHIEGPSSATTLRQILTTLPKTVVCPTWWADQIDAYELEASLMQQVTVERVPMSSLKERDDAPMTELVRFDRNPPALGPKSKAGKASIAEEEDA